MAAQHRMTRATKLKDGRVFLSGDATEIYDPVAGTFTLVGGPPSRPSRFGHTATLLDDGKVLLVGGRENDSTLG